MMMTTKLMPRYDDDDDDNNVKCFVDAIYAKPNGKILPCTEI
jgi:hypothetical protein